MPAKKKGQLAVYRSKATKEPFELVIDAESSLFFEQPDSDTMITIDQAANSEEAMRLLVGDQYDELMKVIGKEPGGVLKLLSKDIQEHFGLGE
jgi:hypothetical protein